MNRDGSNNVIDDDDDDDALSQEEEGEEIISRRQRRIEHSMAGELEDNDEDLREEEEEEEDEDDDDDEVQEEDEEEEEEGNGSSSSMVLEATTHLASLEDSSLREIGHEAIWSLSTAKPGNGVEQIRDCSLDTYWQSDGGQPHLVNIQFTKLQRVSELAFYLDYTLDESYTPNKLSIRSGMTFHDLTECKVVEFSEPVGWCSIVLHQPPIDDDEEEEEEEQKEKKLSLRPIKTHFLQICVVSMHQNGRDTHIRQIKIFGPRTEEQQPHQQLLQHSSSLNVFTIPNKKFQTIEMSQYSVIR